MATTAYQHQSAANNIGYNIPQTHNNANDKQQLRNRVISATQSQQQHQPTQHLLLGRSKFWCGGRIMTGPDLKNLLLTVVLITVPVALFLAFPAVDLITWGYNTAPNVAGCWAVIVCSILYIITMLLLCRTALIDPGIIPPNPSDENTYKFRPRISDVVHNGIHTQLKYCDTCNIIRPPRSIHCSICNQCMDTFDHHCVCIVLITYN